MYWLSIASVMVTVIAFAFAIYTYFKTESKKAIEAANVAVQKERLRSALYSLQAIYHSTDSIVQIPKKCETSVGELQDLARVTRGQIIALMEQLEIQRTGLEKWRFGELVPSAEMGPIKLDVKELRENPRHDEGK
jgi:hypothetical protein